MLISQQKKLYDDFKGIGYLYSRYLDSLNEVTFDWLTDINLAFIKPDKNGDMYLLNEKVIENMIRTAHEANVGAFILVAGGAIDETITSHFLKVMQSENRMEFITKIMTFVDKYNLDGVDVDIEWNIIPSITDMYTPFVLELKRELQKKNKQITLALNVAGLRRSIPQESLEAYNFINVMVYNKTQHCEPEDVGPHSTYSHGEETSPTYWIEERNIDPKKLTLGMLFYAYDFKNVLGMSYKKIVALDVNNAYADQFDLNLLLRFADHGAKCRKRRLKILENHDTGGRQRHPKRVFDAPHYRSDGQDGRLCRNREVLPFIPIRMVTGMTTLKGLYRLAKRPMIM